jgi:hypothetical protein
MPSRTNASLLPQATSENIQKPQIITQLLSNTIEAAISGYGVILYWLEALGFNIATVVSFYILILGLAIFAPYF